jgi:hypothetical protein
VTHRWCSTRDDVTHRWCSTHETGWLIVGAAHETRWLIVGTTHMRRGDSSLVQHTWDEVTHRWYSTHETRWLIVGTAHMRRGDSSLVQHTWDEVTHRWYSTHETRWLIVGAAAREPFLRLFYCILWKRFSHRYVFPEGRYLVVCVRYISSTSINQERWDFKSDWGLPGRHFPPVLGFYRKVPYLLMVCNYRWISDTFTTRKS